MRDALKAVKELHSIVVDVGSVVKPDLDRTAAEVAIGTEAGRLVGRCQRKHIDSVDQSCRANLPVRESII